MNPAATLTWLVLTACLLLGAGCGETEEARLEKVYALAGTNIAAAQAAMVRHWNAGEITMQGALQLSHERLESPGDGPSTCFAAAVLGAMKVLEPQLVRKETSDFFWMRVGRLAADAAATAYLLNDPPAARDLVLAGPQRWQTEAYWDRNPSHDAFASKLMAMTGDPQGALVRLRLRADPAPEVVSTIDEINLELRRSQAQPGR